MKRTLPAVTGRLGASPRKTYAQTGAAVLKAMGYGPYYFLRFVMTQSFYLSIFGFFPGWLFSWLLYQLLSEWTGLVMQLSPLRILLVFCLTFVMCAISGALAVRKLWEADPATLFK